MHVVKIACERPDARGVSLSTWFCADIAKQLVVDGVVTAISPETVRRILQHHQLKPWRHHLWISPSHPRDAAFFDAVREVIDLYVRPLAAEERVISLDEKTSMQPRPRQRPTRPAGPGNHPNLVEHEYTRVGALNLFAGVDTRSGHVYGQCHARKRQGEFLQFLELLDHELPASIQRVHLVCDNVSIHRGKTVRQWLQTHPRFLCHFTPPYASWINQIEQWFSILQRKRLRIVDFASPADLMAKLMAFIRLWNQDAHPFNWSTKSVAKVMAKETRVLEHAA